MSPFRLQNREKGEESDEKGIEATRKEDADVEHASPAQEQRAIDPELEKRVRRKLDWHLVPLVSALYMLAFLDRSNIGYVLLQQHLNTH